MQHKCNDKCKEQVKAFKVTSPCTPMSWLVQQ